jgi:hypothetical protein
MLHNDSHLKAKGDEALALVHDAAETMRQALWLKQQGYQTEADLVHARAKLKQAHAEKIKCEYELMHWEDVIVVRQIELEFLLHPECKTYGELAALHKEKFSGKTCE